jgi:hypothetical protein
VWVGRVGGVDEGERNGSQNQLGEKTRTAIEVGAAGGGVSVSVRVQEAGSKKTLRVWGDGEEKHDA